LIVQRWFFEGVRRSGMQTRSLPLAALVAAVVLAGCVGFGAGGSSTPESTPQPTDAPNLGPTTTAPTVPATATDTAPPPAATDAADATDSSTRTNQSTCSRSTPRPHPDLRLINRVDDARELSVNATRENASRPAYEETLTLGPDEDVDRYDVIPERDTYRIVADSPNATATTTVMEVRPDSRYSIVTVILYEEVVVVETLGVHPRQTATPCPE
jgi:hypothetical protein